jgi:hypothetical protein
VELTHAPPTQLVPPSQTRGFPPTQAPAWQASACVQASPSLHAAPFVLAGWLGAPALHASFVQALPSSEGKSLSSAIVERAPLPSHTALEQSPAVCAATLVFAAVNARPQTPVTHVRVWHASSAPAQSVGARHATQVPSPSHWVPPIAHGLPAATGLLTGIPSSQTSSVHELLSSTGLHVEPPLPLLLASVLLPGTVPTRYPEAFPLSHDRLPRRQRQQACRGRPLQGVQSAFVGRVDRAEARRSAARAGVVARVRGQRWTYERRVPPFTR